MAETSAEQRGRSPYLPMLVTYVCVLVLGMCLTWAFLSMRAVMGVGGSCASGGAYEIATPCPDGSWLIAVAIPVMILATLSGSGFASTVGGPALLLPMWAILFSSLGWNFLEFAFKDGLSFSWLVCGVLFWAMAAPAWWAMLLASKATFRTEPATGLWWWVIYLALGAGGAYLGLAVYALASG